MFIEYGKLSTEVYELTKPVGTSLNGDLEYYTNALKKAGGKVLEAGVGTGRLLIPLLKEGIDIVGADLSPYMLNACRKNCLVHKVDTQLYEQDLQQLCLPYKFQAIIMPTGSFCLLAQRKVAIDVLNNFKDYLAPGGKIIIDLELPVDFAAEKLSTAYYNISDTAGILFTSTPIEMDWENQTTTRLHRYEKWEQGKLIESELSKFVLAWYGIDEFKLLLQNLGFREITYVFDYGRQSRYKNIVTFIASL